MKRPNIRHGSPFRFGIFAAIAAAASFPATDAFAIEAELGGGWNARIDSEVTTGFQVRTQGKSCSLIGRDNGGCAPIGSELLDMGYAAVPDFNYLQMDSGNLNYDAGDVVSWVVKGTHDLSIKGPSDWSALTRVNWVSDLVADSNSNFGLQGDADQDTEFDVTLLDAWVAKGFEWFGQSAKIRVGNQVVSWGEDIFIPGGINSINAIDLRKLHTPGTALKEVFIPAPMVYLNSGITDNLSGEAYYQFMWNDFEFDPAGTFFSTGDVVGRGNFPAFVSSSVAGFPPGSVPPGTLTDEHNLSTAVPVPRVGSNDPSDQGQFGLTLRYQLGDAEIAAHYIRYHDKLPFISFNGSGADFTPASFFYDYGEYRNLYGISGNIPVATAFGDIVFGAELSYRPEDSVAIDPTVAPSGSPYGLPLVGVGRGYVEEEKWQAHLTANHLFSPDSPLGTFQDMIGGTDGWILGEVVFVNYPGLDENGGVPYLLPDYSLPDRFSMGYVIEVGMTFPHILGTAVNFTPFIDFMHDVHGTSPNALPFVEGRKSLAINLGFNYLGTMRANLVYAMFMDGGQNNLMKDRDFFGASFTYSF